MKKTFAFLLACLLLFALSGCNAGSAPNTPTTQDMQETSKHDAIPFADGQLYAVAYLGYEEIGDLAFYTENYLDNDSLPIHYISNGEFYLVIPRYADMSVRLYRNDLETAERVPVYEQAESRPFIIRCNISDIFSNVTIGLTYQTETVEFSPYISLKDGSVEVGEYGLDITHTPQ